MARSAGLATRLFGQMWFRKGPVAESADLTCPPHPDLRCPLAHVASIGEEKTKNMHSSPTLAVRLLPILAVKRVSGREAVWFQRGNAKPMMRVSNFFHRVNANSTIDSICSGCFQTIAVARSHEDLKDAEDAHSCIPLHERPHVGHPIESARGR